MQNRNKFGKILIVTINKLLQEGSRILLEQSFPNEQLSKNVLPHHSLLSFSLPVVPRCYTCFKPTHFWHPKAPQPTEMYTTILCTLMGSELPTWISALCMRKCYSLPGKLYLFPGKIRSKQQNTVKTALSTCHQPSLRTQKVLQLRQEYRALWVYRHVHGSPVVNQEGTIVQCSLSPNKWQDTDQGRENRSAKEESSDTIMKKSKSKSSAKVTFYFIFYSLLAYVYLCMYIVTEKEIAT